MSNKENFYLDLSEIFRENPELNASILTPEEEKRDIVESSETVADPPNKEEESFSTPLQPQEIKMPREADSIQSMIVPIGSSLRLPAFTQDKLTVWLKTVKGILKAHNVKDEDLYQEVRKHMPVEIVERAPELIDPPEEEKKKWSYFEDKLKEVFGKKRDAEVREVIETLTLSHLGPKRLMEEMIEKAKDDLSHMVLADLFIRKLPTEVGRHIHLINHKTPAANNQDLRDLANIAEGMKTFDDGNTSGKSVSAISQNNTQNSQHKNMESDHSKCNKRMNDLENKISHLQKVINGLLDKNANNNSQGNGNWKNTGQNRGKSKGRSKSKAKIDYNAPENKGKCQFHIQYGANAYHCILPCIESGKTLAQKPPKTYNRQSRVDQQGNSRGTQ